MNPLLKSNPSDIRSDAPSTPRNILRDELINRIKTEAAYYQPPENKDPDYRDGWIQKQIGRRWKPAPKWMTDDPIIGRILKRTKFWPVLMSLWRHHSKPIDRDRDGSPIYFVGEAKLYIEMSAELGISVISIKKYVNAFCRCVVLKQMEIKEWGLKRNARAYQIGHLRQYPKGGKRWVMLLNRKLYKLIREFRVLSE